MVTEKVLRVDAADLVKIRLVCQSCKVAVEFDLNDEKSPLLFRECPVCQRQSFSHDADSAGSPAIQNLIRAIKHLKDIRAKVAVEFVIVETLV